MNIRFIHAADLHLDTPFKGLHDLPTPVREKLIQSTFVAFDNLVQLALAERVDFMLFAGDIYDSATRSLKAQLRFKQGLEKLSNAGIASFVIHGNHDPLDGAHIPIEWPELVYFFSGKQVESLSFYQEGQEVATVYGFSYPTARFTTNVVRQFHRESEAFSIGLLHTNCEGEAGHDNYAPCSKADLLQANMDYWALGHIHQRRVINHDPPIVYPGNLQGRHRLETGEKGCYLVEVHPGKQVELTFVPVQDVLWLEEKLDISNMQEFQEVLNALEEVISRLKLTYQVSIILRISLIGQTALWDELSQVDVLEELALAWRNQEMDQESFVWLESIQFEGEMSYEREELLTGVGLHSDLIQLVDEWMASPASLEQLEEEPWSPLLTHPRARRILSPFSAEEKAQLLKQAEHLLLSELLRSEKK